MALVLKDRVKETTTTQGTGTYTLAGAVAGFEAFSEIGDGNTTYYCCTDGTDFEVGVGTYTASGTTLARTTILQSSSSDAAVDWASGSRDIFCTQPAEKAVFLNADGNLDIGTGFITASDGAIGFKTTGTNIASASDTNFKVFRDLVIQGTSDDLVFFRGLNYTTTLTSVDPSAQNQIITLPDATGTVALTSDIPSSGISSGDVATFTSGVADNDFLKINGTSVEGRSAAEVLDDIGAMPLSQSINAQTGSMVTALSDAGNIITLNSSSAITVTIAPNFLHDYPVGTRIDFIQIGAGQVTFEGGIGVTVNATPTLKLRAQHSAASCIQIATNIWQLVGDLAES